MAIKKLNSKKKFGSLGLGAFPTIKEDSTIKLIAKNISLRKRRHSYSMNGVPKIPSSFYQNVAKKNDNLMQEINKLQNKQVAKQSDVANYLCQLQSQINADKTWLAISSGNKSTFSLVDEEGVTVDTLSSSNELISHAMSIDHLMLVKNKIYIDKLLDNKIGLTSLFIVPIKDRGSHGMLLAGYKVNQAQIDNIVITLDKSKLALKKFL